VQLPAAHAAEFDFASDRVLARPGAAL